MHKPQGKNLYAGTLFLGFVSMGPKAACALLQGEALSPWEPSSSPSCLLHDPYWPFAMNLVVFVTEGKYGSMQNWKRLEGVP